jgi:uncharacterized protein (DUF1697 family)
MLPSCIALLRGINVGRAKRIAMVDLRGLLEGLGYADVRTLLNSGNAVFRAQATSSAKIASTIEQQIAGVFNHQVAVVVVTASELDAIIQDNPIPQHANVDPSRFLVAFVKQMKALDAARQILSQSWEPEAFALGKKAAYLWCSNGIIESKVAKSFSSALGEAATTRNWATVLKLQQMLAGNG